MRWIGILGSPPSFNPLKIINLSEFYIRRKGNRCSPSVVALPFLEKFG
jgi:hypothetical protein